MLNGGDLLKPQLLEDAPREVRGRIPAELGHLRFVVQAMRRTAGGGTAKVVGRHDADMGGKTGTAQVTKLKMTANDRRLRTAELAYLHRDHAWIATWGSKNGKTYVVIVMVEHGGGGSSVAGPVAKKVYEYLFGGYRRARLQGAGSAPARRQDAGHRIRPPAGHDQRQQRSPQAPSPLTTTGTPHGQAPSRLYQLGTAGLHAAALLHGRGQPLFRQRHPRGDRFRLRELLPAPAGLGPVRPGLHAAGHAVRLPAAAQSGLARLSDLPGAADAGAPGRLHLLRRQALDLLRPVHHPAFGTHQDRRAHSGGAPAGPRQSAPGLEELLFRPGRGAGARGLHPQAARPRARP